MKNKCHILISKATRKPYNEMPDLPEGVRYDPSLGFWKLGNQAFVESNDFEAQKTKKCDLETGEDQKGE